MKDFWQMKIRIELTWSKLIALIVLIMGYDLQMNDHAGMFMYVMPFVVFLITGKWVSEGYNKIKNAKDGGKENVE